MSLMITDECISCGVCLPECPNEAIVEDNGVFRIRGGRCTECAGFFDEPKCRELCPVSECIVPNPRRPETREMLLEKHRRLELRKRVEAAMKVTGL